MDSVLSLFNKNFTRDGKKFEKVSRTVRKAESHLHWQIIGIWQIMWRLLMESSNVYTSSIRDQRNCRRSITKSEGRNISRITAVRIGLDMVGLILWNAIAICDTSKTSWRIAKPSMEDDSESQSRDRSFHLEPWQNIIRFQWEINPGFTIWKESSTWNLSRICIVCGGNLERRHSDCCRIEEIGRIRNLSKTSQCQRSTDLIKKEKSTNSSQQQMVQQDCHEETTNPENPL